MINCSFPDVCPEHCLEYQYNNSVLRVQFLTDALKELRKSLDPDDFMGEVSMHDFIDAKLEQVNTIYSK